jgi:hypothetical protein
VLVCDTAAASEVCDDAVLVFVLPAADAAVVAVVAVVALVEDDDDEVEPVDCVLEFAADAWVGVVVPCPSRQAIAPPRESMVAMLSAVAALRARAARGLRRRAPPAPGGEVGEVVGSSMPVTVRKRGQGSTRGG